MQLKHCLLPLTGTSTFIVLYLSSILNGCLSGGRYGLEAALAQRAVHEREDADDEDDPENRERGAEERRRRAGQLLARLEERLQPLVRPRVLDRRSVLQPCRAVSECVEVLAVAH